MYDPNETLANIDAHKWPILALCAVAMLFNYYWFFIGLRQARRDRVYSIPAASTFFFLVGDASFLLHYDDWFHGYRHWYVELFWAALTVTVLFEVAFTVQVVQYGRAELLPTATRARFAAVVVGGVIAAAVVWSMVRQVISDPLFITYFDLANVAGALAGTGLLLRRRSRAGQTVGLWLGYAAMATAWFVAESLWFGPAFRSREYLALAVVCVVSALANAWYVHSLPRYEADALPTAPPARDRDLHAVGRA